ncbi:hypothetical protein [Oceanobacillus saliphilus]|uniref:hypothetical protein n=1 Tax=Oceanobacillus saliphilus TaxID=2925834 RepID=UPI00201D9C88|nr:hypothetical protein [Oceanobacillus saliphilus]
MKKIKVKNTVSNHKHLKSPGKPIVIDSSTMKRRPIKRSGGGCCMKASWGP